MKTYTQEQLNEIIKNHGRWIRDDGGERADLRGADLRDAKLWPCSGNRNEIKSLFLSEEYAIAYTSEYLQIGCECHRIIEWWDFDDRRIAEMDGKKALKFWRKYKDFIRHAIDLSPATRTGNELDNKEG